MLRSVGVKLLQDSNFHINHIPYNQASATVYLIRHLLAAIHFNHNLLRDVKKRPDGSNQIRVVYPKFKGGEATVRNVTVKPHYGK